jgi:hypothetical protein
MPTASCSMSRSSFVDARWNELDERVWEGFFEVDHALDDGGSSSLADLPRC